MPRRGVADPAFGVRHFLGVLTEPEVDLVRFFRGTCSRRIETPIGEVEHTLSIQRRLGTRKSIRQFGAGLSTRFDAARRMPKAPVVVGHDNMQNLIVRLWRPSPEAGQGFQGFWAPIIPRVLYNDGGTFKDSVSTPFEFCAGLMTTYSRWR